MGNETSEPERVVFSSDDMTTVDTCSLVLSAKSIPHRVERSPDGSATIVVSAKWEREAAAQLNAYFRENRNWPPSPVDITVEPLSTPLPAILIMAVMAAFYMVTGPFQHDSVWFSRGAADSTAILRNGEAFRLITALCLHADFSHIAGNMLIGGFLLHYFLQINGAGIGLLLMIIAAATGNYWNALLHGPGHLSVGFSTAVFALIGLLSAHRVLVQKKVGIEMLVPFLAGAALLAMLGSSGVRTDLGAHLFGLLAGIIYGIGAGMLPIGKFRRSAFIQNCCLLTSIFMILVCWNLALGI